MEDKRIVHYSSSQKILLVGEGDFSFSVCLAKAFGSAPNITATSLDSKGSLLLKYSNASTNLRQLEIGGCTILHGVDAHSMRHNPYLQGMHFDRIIFNFPHAGFEDKESSLTQICRHKDLVRGFLDNARQMLTVGGEIHVTHKTSHPFSSWEIEKLANHVGLKLVEEVPFSIWDYPSYSNKRGSGMKCDESFPVGQCSTFKFALNDFHLF